MRTDSQKIVPLKTALSGGKNHRERLPVPLVDLRDRSSRQLRHLLQALFDKADDALFQMADRAGCNTEQNACFEAMRDLRTKRRGIERSFLQKVFDSFSNLYRLEDEAAPSPISESTQLASLTHKERQQEQIDIDAMIERFMQRTPLNLQHLDMRLNILLGKAQNRTGNPIGPRWLIQHFLNTCQEQGIDPAIKPTILKLFERHVLTNIDELYGEANKLLSSNGLLPELQALQSQRRPAHPEDKTSLDQAFYIRNRSATENTEDVFEKLQTLLVLSRSDRLLATQPDHRPIPPGDLLQLLTRQQQHRIFRRISLQERVERLIRRLGKKIGNAWQLGRNERDTVILCSLLFESMEADRNLSEFGRHLLARLQIPLLKATLLDRTLFNRANHPTRRLINEIASATLGMNDLKTAQRDAVYQKIDQALAKLADNFTNDLSIFTELLTDLQAFSTEERRRSSLLEQRMRDTEEGRAKAEIARQEVERILNERLFGKILPEVVVQLLQEVWSKVLLLAFLKYGSQSIQWQDALRTMDDLLWSIAPNKSPEARQQLLELAPQLLKDLREGLASIAFDAFATTDFFAQLEQLQLHALQQTLQLLDSEEAAIEPFPLFEVTERIFLPMPGDTCNQKQEIELPNSHAAILEIDNLHPGVWVEFIGDQEHRLRCKLAAIIKPAAKYIFVNRNGIKVLEKTRTGLALDFHHKAVRQLDDSPLFDRAVKSLKQRFENTLEHN
ncbi:DUF1631 domain-containing protein [Azomonas macrocytogenes]|uniref:Thymidine phosphorylase n=1 Tax=Azomonas macrocytogenes TaxID=69962 RepID=A0A839T1L2_AZOMA|nr:DUF1631 domain-containing protein [Azomonas macrocytogenes]MBB3102406.1 hypothetical protein [Azomonas macrocytogenes]